LTAFHYLCLGTTTQQDVPHQGYCHQQLIIALLEKQMEQMILVNIKYKLWTWFFRCFHKMAQSGCL